MKCSLEYIFRKTASLGCQGWFTEFHDICQSLSGQIFADLETCPYHACSFLNDRPTHVKCHSTFSEEWVPDVLKLFLYNDLSCVGKFCMCTGLAIEPKAGLSFREYTLREFYDSYNLSEIICLMKCVVTWEKPLTAVMCGDRNDKYL